MTWEEFFEAIEDHLHEVLNALNGLSGGQISAEEAAESLSHIPLP
jgi:hypothetical protein